MIVLGVPEAQFRSSAMQQLAKSKSSPADPQADFCGELESYAVTGEATIALDRLCGELWSCHDTLPALACKDAGAPAGSTYAAAARRIKSLIRPR
jgi:hypothetical protein